VSGTVRFSCAGRVAIGVNPDEAGGAESAVVRRVELYRADGAARPIPRVAADARAVRVKPCNGVGVATAIQVDCADARTRWVLHVPQRALPTVLRCVVLHCTKAAIRPRPGRPTLAGATGIGVSKNTIGVPAAVRRHRARQVALRVRVVAAHALPAVR
jgi:hypothetical protein